MADITLTNAKLLKDGRVLIETEDGTYYLTAEQVQVVLVEDAQMCEACFDTREIIEDGTDIDGNVERGTVTRKCSNH